MRARKKAATWLTAAFCCVTLQGCDDEHWGDALESFANQKSAPLSTDFAAAFLTERWMAAHQIQALGFQTNLKAHATYLARVNQLRDAQDIPETEVALALVDAEKGLESLLVLQRELEASSQSLEAWRKVCSNREFFDLSELSKVSLPAPEFSLPTAEYRVQVDLTSWIMTAIDNIGNFLDGIRGVSVEQQNEKARNAVATFNARKIQGDALFALSEKICTQTALQFEEVRSRISDTLTQLHATLRDVRDSVQTSRRIIEARVAPLNLESFLAADGTLALLLQQQKQRESADLTIDLQALRQQLRSQKRTVIQAIDCERRLSAVEDLETSLFAAKAQVEFLLAHGNPDSELRATLTQLHAELSATLQSTRNDIIHIVDGSPDSLKDCT